MSVEWEFLSHDCWVTAVNIDMYTYAATAGVGPHYPTAPPTYLPPHHQLAAPGLGAVPPPTGIPSLSPHTKRRR